MQQYTKQQREGGGRYGAGCLVGNWSEELEQQGSTIKSFLSKSETGSLKLTSYQERMAVALAAVELTRICDEPYVHFGDVVQLMHANSGSMLACSVHDKDPRPSELSCSATATAALCDPVARNTFLITKYVPPKQAPLDCWYDDDVLRYGQKFRLVVNPLAQGEPLDAAGGPEPLSLFSRPKTTTSYARFSRHQVAAFTYRNTFDAVWEAQPLNPADRIACQGVEVAAGAPLLLVHCATQAPLCLEAGCAVPNDFGIETEVSVHMAMAPGMQQGLEHLAKGETTRALPKPQLSPNHWAFITGPALAALPPGNAFAADASPLLDSIAADLAAKPGRLEGLQRKAVMLGDLYGEVEAGELLVLLRQCGACVQSEDGEVLAAEFGDAGRPGRVGVARLVAALAAKVQQSQQH